LIPHLAEAHRICGIITMRQPDNTFRQAVALCNPSGALIEIEPGFYELLAKEYRATLCGRRKLSRHGVHTQVGGKYRA